MIKGTCLLYLLLSLSTTLLAQSSEVERRKAQTYFDNEEWGMANTIYNSLLQEQPQEGRYYPYAIVSLAQRDTTTKVIDYIEMAQANSIEMATLLEETRNLARKTGNIAIYIRMLNEIKKEQPWFANFVDRLLLKHYLFQKEYEAANTLVQSLIERFPTSLEVKRAQAEVLLQSGDTYRAIDVYSEILDENEHDLDALLYLGGHYLLTAEKKVAKIQNRYNNIVAPTHMQQGIYRGKIEEIQKSDVANATEYLKRAYEIHPTSYIQELLIRCKQLEEIDSRMQPL